MCNRKIIFLFLIQNICCEYSKEPSQSDGSFVYPKHMLNIIGKRIFTILHWNLCLSKPVESHSIVCVFIWSHRWYFHRSNDSNSVLHQPLQRSGKCRLLLSSAVIFHFNIWLILTCVHTTWIHARLRNLIWLQMDRIKTTDQKNRRFCLNWL